MTTTDTTDERRGLPSASALGRLAACPGSLAAEQAAPAEETSSPEADSGTAIHAVLAGETPARPLTEEETRIAEACDRLLQETACGTYGPLEHADTLVREERLWLRAPDKTPLLSGKPDLVAIYGMRALIVDFKTGRAEVTNAASNLQLRALVTLVAANHIIREATVVIIQPFSETGTTAARYEDDDIAAAREHVLQILSDAANPWAPRVPSPEACKYCRAKALCPEARELAVTPPIPVPDYIQATELAAALTDAKLGAFLDHAAFAERVIDACRDEAKRRITAGQAVPGWALKPGRASETITDPQTVYDRFTFLGGNGEQFLECVTVGKTKLKDMVRALTTARGKALDAHLEAMLAGCTETKTSAPILTRDTTTT